MAMELVRDHGSHPRHVLHRGLAAHEPESEGEDHRAAGENPEVRLRIAIHPEHEREHDDGHGRSHHQRHVGSRLAEKDVIERVGV